MDNLDCAVLSLPGALAKAAIPGRASMARLLSPSPSPCSDLPSETSTSPPLPPQTSPPSIPYAPPTKHHQCLRLDPSPYPVSHPNPSKTPPVASVLYTSNNTKNAQTLQRTPLTLASILLRTLRPTIATSIRRLDGCLVYRRGRSIRKRDGRKRGCMGFGGAYCLGL